MVVFAKGYDQVRASAAQIDNGAAIGIASPIGISVRHVDDMERILARNQATRPSFGTVVGWIGQTKLKVGLWHATGGDGFETLAVEAIEDTEGGITECHCPGEDDLEYRS